MSYLNNARRPSAASMAAVVAIHAGLGALLLTGLTVSGIITQHEGPLVVIDPYDPPPPPPPPPPPEAQTPQPSQTLPDLFVPKPDLPLAPADPLVPTTDIQPRLIPPTPLPTGTASDTLLIPAKPAFDPVAARPKNNPGTWLTDNDYRPNWARQELTGRASFRLQIGTNGRVTGCEITGSTGHAALDEATCALVSKRARFEPARGRDGEAIAGSYTGAVFWKLPE